MITDELDGNDCWVCGDGVRYGEKHHGCDPKKELPLLRKMYAGQCQKTDELRSQVSALTQDYGLLEISLEHKKTLLASCEVALTERDNQVSALTEQRDRLLVALASSTKMMHGNFSMAAQATNNDRLIAETEGAKS